MKNVVIIGNTNSKIRLIQPIDRRDAGNMDGEYERIRELSGREDFMLCACAAESWNDDLSPWRAPAAFGSGFGGGGEVSLGRILDEVIPYLDGEYGAGAEYYLGGYSLAGLFALWASYRSDAFAGVAAVSPSLWFPGWKEFSFGHNTLARKVYLSLGDAEEKSRNSTLASVGEAVRRQYRILSSMAGVRSALEWNEGNHFREPELRVAKGFAWLIKDE